MRTIFKNVLIGIGVSLLVTAQGFSAPLHVVTLPYPPYQYEENGELKGFTAAIVKEVFKRMEQPIEIQVLPFARAIQMIQDGDADAIFTAAKNPERETFADFTTEVLVEQKMSLFASANSPITFAGDLSQLARYRVGVIVGFRYGAVFDEAVKNKVLPKIDAEATSPESNAQKLVAGRIDLWMSNREQALFTIRGLKLTEAIQELKPEVQIIPSYLAFSKKRNLGAIRDRFDTTIRAMKDDGTYEQLIADYWK